MSSVHAARALMRLRAAIPKDEEVKEAFSAAIRECKPGDKVKLKILRDDEEIEVEVELGEKK